MKKILYSWSGGKDSAMALYELQKNRPCEILALLTVLTEDYGRISMHGVREELLESQAASLGLGLKKVLMHYKKLGAEAVAFGDIFLEDLKRYREDRLQEIGIKGIFPLWKRDSRELANAFIDLGFKAVITCVDSNVLDRTFSGRLFNKQFLSDLPSGVDPCGENGEFHSFVYDGPIFKKPVPCDTGKMVLRERRFYYSDILPK